MDVELKHGFKYHHDNDEVDAKFITISAYTMKQMETIAPIKEIVMKALGKYAEGAELSAAEIADVQDAADKAKASDEPQTVADGGQLMTIICMNCAEGDLGKLYAYMQKLLTSGVAYIDGSSAKLTGTYVPKMNPDDFEKVVGEYIGNFIT